VRLCARTPSVPRSQNSTITQSSEHASARAPLALGMPVLDTESQDFEGCCSASVWRPSFTERGSRERLLYLRARARRRSARAAGQRTQILDLTSASAPPARARTPDAAANRRPTSACAAGAAQPGRCRARLRTSQGTGRRARARAHQEKASVRSTHGWPPPEVSVASSGSEPLKRTLVTSRMTWRARRACHAGRWSRPLRTRRLHTRPALRVFARPRLAPLTGRLAAAVAREEGLPPQHILAWHASVRAPQGWPSGGVP